MVYQRPPNPIVKGNEFTLLLYIDLGLANCLETIWQHGGYLQVSMYYFFYGSLYLGKAKKDAIY